MIIYISDKIQAVAKCEANVIYMQVYGHGQESIIIPIYSVLNYTNKNYILASDRHA